ncbi:unnamed protein product [Malus baccata var. baccata]
MSTNKTRISLVSIKMHNKMEKKQVGDLVSVTFTWRIEKFSRLRPQKHYSDSFAVGDFKWQIVVYPKGSSGNPGKHDLSIYLNVADATTLSSGWSRYAQFTLTVVNQLDSDKSITFETKHVFSASKSDWGFTSFMPLSELSDCTKGFLVNDACVLEAEVAVSQEEPSSEQYCPEPNDSPVESPIVKEHELARSTPLGELMDFRGLGKIDKDYVPFLEEVCLLHPSLIECQRKRSRMFTEWAFTALGRLLHFLKTTRGKDMIEAPCEEHLQLLWEELGTFKFDLAWLGPHVQSALGMKKFVERERHVTELRNNVDALDIEIKRLKAWLTVAEVELVGAKTDMGEAEQSFVAINMDSELGYGGWH